MKAHLAQMRTGWQNENFARYVLSKFSFVSHPATVADDIGSDFFCTTFQTVSENRHDYLLPKNSFAIQIKSSKRPFLISHKLEYLRNLEIPFLVGVCNQNTSEVELYSGEYLIPFFVDVKSCEAVEVKLCARDTEGEIYHEDGKGKFIIKFPKIITISHEMAKPELNDLVSTLGDLCNLISRNIAKRNNREYIFSEYTSPRLLIPFDEKDVKSSLEIRISKVFFEMAWLLERKSEIFSLQELQNYQDLMQALLKHSRVVGE